MGTQKQSLLRLQIGMAFFGLLLVGLLSGAWGVLLPGLSDFYRINKSVVGLLFFASATGYFLSALCSGFLTQKLGLRWYLILGTAAFLAGNLILFIKPPFALVLLTRIFMGIGVAVIEAGLNMFIAALPKNNTSYLNYLHAFFGVGALIGPVVASFLLNAQWDWSATFLVWAAVTLLLLVGFIFFFHQPPVITAEESGEAMEGQKAQQLTTSAESSLLAALKLPIVWLATFYLFVYCGVETSIGNWAYSFLLEQRQEPELLAGWIVSGYWMGLTLGRFIFSDLAKRLHISISGMMYLALGGTLLGLLILTTVPGVAADALGFGLIGFSIGPIYPTTVALVPNLVPARVVANTIGFLIGLSTLGIAIFPWFAGTLAQYSGIWSLLPYTAVLALTMGCFWWGIARKLKTAAKSEIALEEKLTA
ncbi:MFS transporter [Reticulibacter mediterranei]|uniref:MFS transporter n=1 Tax=Reticulibacter mediterranei TaxID=2778369 RepID=A0A8J3ILZ0_9CHLR|nr:MFS transporter [Reticulibacter mediterranei]GHO94024.1 MFS transporter [Reticulibacter mediterranei]